MVKRERRTAVERRKDVITAAITEFALYGYHAASTVRIAEHAQISQPYVLHLFGTKLNLFIETMSYVRDSMVQAWEESLSNSPLKGVPALDHLGDDFMDSPLRAMQFRLTLQSAAVAEIPEVEKAINENVDILWGWLEENSGATYEEIQVFWAFGMMVIVGQGMNAHKFIETSRCARAMMIPPEDLSTVNMSRN